MKHPGECNYRPRSMRPRRVLAAVLAGLLLLAAAPAPARADGDKGIWTVWAEQLTNREYQAEVPIAVVFSLPAMLLVTPFWLAQEAIEEVRGEEED